jgi:hypothetical protein
MTEEMTESTSDFGEKHAPKALARRDTLLFNSNAIATSGFARATGPAQGRMKSS